MRKIKYLFFTALALTWNVAKAADTVYDGETVSVTWTLAEGEENSKAVLSDRKTVMDFSWSCGTSFKVKGKRSIGNDLISTEFYPLYESGSSSGSYNTGDYIEWSLTPYDALSFKPTKVSVYAFKHGTDAPKMNIYVIDGTGEIYDVESDEPMVRIDGSHAYDPDNDSGIRTFNLTDCQYSPNSVKLRIYINNCGFNKTFSLANVVVEGTVTGVSHFREEYAVNIAANNPEWGTVKSSKDYVVEENPVTLTATPNRGYRFVGWQDENEAYVSTDAVYTFVPEANINLTAIFEPLTVYQVSVTSNLDGAGIISVTTFEDGIYYEGDVIDIHALPNVGYAFVNWSDNLTNWKRNTITLNSDINLTANFEPIGEPSAYACWPMSSNTNAETTGDIEASFYTDSYLIDTGGTVVIDGVTMRTFTASDDSGVGSVWFHLDVSPKEGQVFVVRSIELDAARVGSSFGEFSIIVGGNEVASNLYPGAFLAGVDYPHSHYYYNLGQTNEISSGVDIVLTTDEVSSMEGKGIAFGNVKIQGYYKTKQVKVTVPYTGYTTYSSTFPLSFGGSGINSFIAKVNNSTVEFVQQATIPACTGVLLKANAGTYWVDVVDEADVVADNALQPKLEAGTVEPLDGDMQNMVFLHKTTGLGFFQPESAYNLKDNTAFLQISSSLGIDFVSAPCQTFNLSETSTAVPTEYATGAIVNVTRTINADEWSTLVLPFNMTESQVKSNFGSAVKLMKLAGYDVEYDEGNIVKSITVNFEDADLSEGLTANYPYLIKSPWNISQFTVEGVDIVPDEDNAVVEISKGQGDEQHIYARFIGTYHAKTIIPNNSLFISENLFWYSTGLTKMKAFRAYFTFEDIFPDTEEASSRILFGFNETTAIKSVSTEKKGDAFYDIQGRKVQHPTKGLYIVGGKKVIIK